MNRIGELLDSVIIEVQNEVDVINEVKQKASEIDIDTLKSIRNTLANILKKRRDIILEMINRDNACNKPDTKKKDNKSYTKKKDNKPDTKKKDDKPDNKLDTKKKDNKPDTKKKDDKPDNKLDTKKKDDKPDTSKNNIENGSSNRFKHEIQDIAKYRKVLIKMIYERMNMLDLMQFQLAESIEDTDINENSCKFIRLYRASRIDIRRADTRFWYKQLVSEIYAVNVALECLRDGVGNGIWPEDVNYNFIASINEISVEKYCEIIILDTKRLIKIACDEIEMARRLIETNIHKYERIIKNAGEMDIYSLDQACADIDNTAGYIRTIIFKISSIVEKIEEKINEKNKKRRKRVFFF